MEGLAKKRVKTKVSMPIINSGLATDQATPNDMFRYRIRKSLSTRFCSRKIRLLFSMPLALMVHARYSTCKYAKSLYARRFRGFFPWQRARRLGESSLDTTRKVEVNFPVNRIFRRSMFAGVPGPRAASFSSANRVGWLHACGCGNGFDEGIFHTVSANRHRHRFIVRAGRGW